MLPGYPLSFLVISLPLLSLLLACVLLLSIQLPFPAKVALAFPYRLADTG